MDPVSKLVRAVLIGPLEMPHLVLSSAMPCRLCPEQIAYFEQMAPGEKVRLSGSLLGGILEGIRKEFTPFCSDPDFQHRAFERLHGGVRPDLSLLLFSLEK